jgi:5-(carboxyamino)imidazole ribonucleotide synthase
MTSPQPQPALDADGGPTAPFPTLGILGGGQLGKMMAQEALRMGIGVRLLSPKEAGPMQGFAGAQTGDWRDADVLARFADGCDAVTVESEWAPAAEARDALSEEVAVWPSPHTLRLISHKGRQKTHLREAGLPVPPFRNCASLDEAKAAAGELGYPVVAKQFEGSYDGYGNATCRDAGDVEDAWENLSAEDGLMIEQFVDFSAELSIIVARRPNGMNRSYAPVHTVQHADTHRCHRVEAPASRFLSLSDTQVTEAYDLGEAAAEAVESVGVLAAELFLHKDGSLSINELAPRPHNTGHVTIEACETSQFENHVRAVLGLPLGDAGLRVPCAVMVNVLGEREGHPPRAGEAFHKTLLVPGASVHIYGKPEVRPGRKMGHVTVTGANREDDFGDEADLLCDDVRRRAEKAADLIQL